MMTRKNIIADIENGMGAEGNTATAERMLDLFEQRGWIDYNERRGYFWIGEFGEELPENGFFEVWEEATCSI